MLPELKEGVRWVVGSRYLRAVAALHRQRRTSSTASRSRSSCSTPYASCTCRRFEVGLVFACGSVGAVLGALVVEPRCRGGSASGRRSSDGVDHVLRRRPRLSARSALVPAAGADRGLVLRPVRRRRLQHHAGQLPAGDHAGAAAGPDERRDALDRLGHDPARDARRRRDRLGVGAHTALWVGAIGGL